MKRCHECEYWHEYKDVVKPVMRGFCDIFKRNTSYCAICIFDVVKRPVNENRM